MFEVILKNYIIQENVKTKLDRANEQYARDALEHTGWRRPLLR